MSTLAAASDSQTQNQTPPYTDLFSLKTVGETKFIKLESLEYVDPSHKRRKWDRAVRTTKQSETSVDAVAVMATLYNGNNIRDVKQDSNTNEDSNSQESDSDQDPKILLVKQFRPAVGCYTLELPAGLVDPNESVEATAVRELQEETGYYGKAAAIETFPDKDSENPINISTISKDLPLSPGFSNENIAFINVDVDESQSNNLPENNSDIEGLQKDIGPFNSTTGNIHGEFIQVYKVRRNELKKELFRIVEESWRGRGEKVKVFGAVWTLAEGIEIGKRINMGKKNHSNDIEKNEL